MAYHATRAFNENTGQHQNDGDTYSPGLLRKRDHGKLTCDDMGIAEIRNRASLRLNPIAHRIGSDGLPQMVFDLLPHAPRQRSVESERADERLEVIRNHADLPDGGVPASRPPMASENCCQTARRSASARSPRRVNA